MRADWLKLPYWALHYVPLDPGVRLVQPLDAVTWAALDDYLHHHGRSPSVRALERASGIPLRTLMRSLGRLCAAGLVQRCGGALCGPMAQRGTQYRTLQPATRDAAPDGPGGADADAPAEPVNAPGGAAGEGTGGMDAAALPAQLGTSTEPEPVTTVSGEPVGHPAPGERAVPIERRPGDAEAAADEEADGTGTRCGSPPPRTEQEPHKPASAANRAALAQGGAALPEWQRQRCQIGNVNVARLATRILIQTRPAEAAGAAAAGRCHPGAEPAALPQSAGGGAQERLAALLEDVGEPTRGRLAAQLAAVDGPGAAADGDWYARLRAEARRRGRGNWRGLLVRLIEDEIEAWPRREADMRRRREQTAAARAERAAQAARAEQAQRRARRLTALLAALTEEEFAAAAERAAAEAEAAAPRGAAARLRIDPRRHWLRRAGTGDCANEAWNERVARSHYGAAAVEAALLTCQAGGPWHPPATAPRTGTGPA